MVELKYTSNATQGTAALTFAEDLIATDRLFQRDILTDLDLKASYEHNERKATATIVLTPS